MGISPRYFLRRVSSLFVPPSSPTPEPVFTAERQEFARYDIGCRTYGAPKVLTFDEQDSTLRIGKYSSIADSVILVGGEHRTNAVSTYPFKQLLPGAQDANNISFSRGEVQIGNDVWIGYGALILSGRKIGDGAVVAAGALVSQDVPPYAIAGGNPARVIKYRFTKEQIQSMLAIAWWDCPESKIVDAASLLSSSNIDQFIQTYSEHSSER
jgi:acetyltransferase-like isoleucine patch superfamily enzyme